MTSRNSTWGAVVIRRGLSWFARAPRELMNRPTPDWAVVDLPRVVLAAGSLWFPREGEGTVLWQCPENLDTHAMTDALRAGGWRVSDSGHETGWFTITRDGFATVHLGIGRMISPGRFPIANLTDSADRIATALVRYGDLMGASWRGTAGMSGCAQIRAIHGGKPSGAQPLWRWDSAKGSDAIRCSFELRGSRDRRPIEPAELDHAHVHQFDVSAMYLAASNVAMLGWSKPEDTGACNFDASRPGYWRVVRDQLRSAQRSAPAELVRPGTSSLVWLTTPVMAYLAEQKIHPEVLDSWTSERGGRYLKSWAERLTAALKMTEPGPEPGTPCVHRALKDTYKRTVGMMAKEGGRIFRPDWRDEIVDRARVNLLRKCAGAGVRPLRFNVDSVWIATDEPAEVIGRRLGIPYDAAGAEVWQIGKFRHIATMTPAEYVTAYERDRERVAA